MSSVLGCYWLSCCYSGCLSSILSLVHHYEVGATRFSIRFRCSVISFPPKFQWVSTVVVSCPDTDMIRIWPLPVVNPWFEDRENGFGVWL